MKKLKVSQFEYNIMFCFPFMCTYLLFFLTRVYLQCGYFRTDVAYFLTLFFFSYFLQQFHLKRYDVLCERASWINMFTFIYYLATLLSKDNMYNYTHIGCPKLRDSKSVLPKSWEFLRASLWWWRPNFNKGFPYMLD